MPYEKDIYGNVIGTGGDDTSLQNAKMAGYPGYNIFEQQREKSLLTPEQVQQRSGVNMGVPNVPKGAVSVVPSGVPVGNPQIVRQPAAAEPIFTGGNASFVGNKAPRYAPITSTEQLAAAMGYTSPEEEERLRKASVTNQRIMAIGDALRHIGNIANTVRYAPSQQFNSPVTDEIARYERGKALRDKANAALLTYQQQKERQDALQRRWENELEYKRQKEEAAAKARADKAKDARDKWKATLAYNKERDEAERKRKEKNDEFNREDKTRRTDAYVAKTMGGGGSAGGGGRRAKAGTGRSANGKMNYWIDVPGKGRVYYPNQTMWKQGVDYYDNEGARYTKTPGGKEKEIPYTQRGANLGRKANNAATKGKTPSKGKATAKGKVSNKSGFFN